MIVITDCQKILLEADSPSLDLCLIFSLSSIQPKTPKDIVMFYVGVANSCYKATGSKRVACVVAAGTCGFTLVPGPHQPMYITACCVCLNGINKM